MEKILRPLLIAMITSFHCGLFAAVPSNRLADVQSRAPVVRQDMPLFVQDGVDPIENLVNKPEGQKGPLFDVMVKNQLSDQWMNMENGAGRGGGGTIFCAASKVSPYQGYYAIDYLTGSMALMPGSLSDISSRIYSRLIEVFPALGISYRHFLVGFYGIYGPVATANIPIIRSWHFEKKLEHLPDEEFSQYEKTLLEKLHRNCLTTGKPNFIQTVVRRKRPDTNFLDKAEYYANGPVLTYLLKQRPLQMSYLLVHEWLRDFLPSTFSVRQINAFIHSPDFFELSLPQMKKRMLELKFTNKPSGDSTLFLETKDEYSEQLRKQTEDFKSKSLQELQTDCVLNSYFSYTNQLESRRSICRQLATDNSITESERASFAAKFFDITTDIARVNFSYSVWLDQFDRGLRGPYTGTPKETQLIDKVGLRDWPLCFQ